MPPHVSHRIVRRCLILGLLCVSSSAFQHRVPTTVRLSLATLHAAELTTPRAAMDSADAPYLLMSIRGPRATSTTIRRPELGQLRVRRDEALGARPLTEVSLEPGDSVRVLVSVLEGLNARANDEMAAAAASTRALAQPSGLAERVTSALSPLARNGGHWLGSVTLLLTNDDGALYWRELDCVATCKVLSGAAATRLPAASDSSVAGVVELTGGGATYHLKLQAARTNSRR